MCDRRRKVLEEAAEVLMDQAYKPFGPNGTGYQYPTEYKSVK